VSAVDERLELRARLVRARRGWLRIEDDAAGLDEELDARVAIARLAILDVVDRVDQLLGAVEAAA
jgi:hypothetical protein